MTKLAYTIPEAGELLSVSARTVRRLMDSGELPACRIGHSVRILHTTLTEFVEDQPCLTGKKDRRSGGFPTKRRKVGSTNLLALRLGEKLTD